MDRWPGAPIITVPSPVRANDLGTLLNDLDRQCEDKLFYAWQIAQRMGASDLLLQQEIIRYMNAQGPASWHELDDAHKQAEAKHICDRAGRNGSVGMRTIIVLLSDSIGSDKAIFSLAASSLLSDNSLPKRIEKQYLAVPSLAIVAPEPEGQPSVIIRGHPPKSGFIIHPWADITKSGDNTWWPKRWIEMGAQEDLEAYQKSNAWSRRQAVRVRLADCFIGGVAFQTAILASRSSYVGRNCDRTWVGKRLTA
jgi:hypothetical protein